MRNVTIWWTLLVLVLLLGCASRTKTKTTYEEPAEYRMPESPKVKADDMQHGYEAK